MLLYVSTFQIVGINLFKLFFCTLTFGMMKRRKKKDGTLFQLYFFLMLCRTEWTNWTKRSGK